MYLSRSSGKTREGLGWVGIVAALLPAVLTSIPTIVGMFKKKKPALTQLQLEALQRLPDPYLSLAVAELEESDNMSADFEDIFRKYSARWQRDKAVKDAIARKQTLTYVLVGAGALATIVTVVAISRS